MLELPGILCFVHLKIQQLQDFCALSIWKYCNFHDFVLNSLKSAVMSGIFVPCAPRNPATVRIIVLCALKDAAISRSSVLCVLRIRSAAIFRIFVLNAPRSSAISKILEWIFRPPGGHGSLLWPLLPGLWVRPIQRGFCSWGPSGSGTEHKYRLTSEEGEPGGRNRYRYR